jgi:conjugative relaxase-like TrwC/TraI family protein
MVASISKPMSQEALETYHSKDNYYSQDDGLENSQWQGRFSARQGLEGTITAAEWKQACQGEDLQGNELRRKQINSRAGWDITLSASKSASLKALVHQDKMVLEAHRAAVTQTVQYIEENCIYAQVKENGILKREQTQKGQFALFEHDDNRNQEPQLHTHIVILNQTLCKDGKSRTLDSRELFNQKVTIGAYYDHAFAHQLQQNGYELDWTSDHTFEIKGYQKDQLEAFSSRRQAIREYLAEQNIRLEQATEEQKQIACLKSRPLKIHKLHPIDHEAQRERWQQESENLGIIHPQPRQDLQHLYDLTAHPGSLVEVIQSALETATAYQVAVTKQTLLRDCLRHSQGHYSPIEIEQALNQSAELIATQDGRITTQRAITREQFILQSANAGQQTQTSLSQPETIEQIAQQQNLNEDQTAGLKHIATSQDFITLLQGNAGVGKTYTLSALTECLAPQQSDRLRGLAPSAAAAQVLQSEANIQSSTLERYLLSPNETLNLNEVLLIDEAGMVSSQQMERLIRKAQALDSRLILVGDIKQLSAVESGAPFRLLHERSELKTVAIEANVRQRVPHLFDAASLAAQHRTNEALKRLEHCDCIEEIPDPAQRNQAVVEQYLNREPREQAQTLILCDTNQDRRDITTQIRAAYIEQDILGSEQTQISILYPKRLDRQAIAQGYNYSVGDVIRLQRPTQQFPDLYYRVLGLKDATLLLKDREGNRHEMPLHQYKEREVFDCQPLELRVGDRLRFTRNHRERNQTNGQPYTIEALNPDHTIEIRTKGQRYTVTPDQLLHSDYAYCRTVYSAQGWTSAEAIWAPGQNPGQEQTYVALTRARESLKILTLDRAALGISVEQSRAQENATDLVEPEHRYLGMDVLAQKIQERNDEKLLLESGLLQELTELTNDLQSLVAPPSNHIYAGMDVLAQKIQERNDEKLFLESGLLEELTELTRDLQSFIAPPAKPLYEGMDVLAQKIQERNDEKLLVESGLLEELTELTTNLQSFISSSLEPPHPVLTEPEPQIQQPRIETTSAEAQQLTLFPGEPDEPQRKPTRRTPRQRSPQRERLHQEHSSSDQSPESTDGQTEQAEPASPADGVNAPSDIAPVRSRFAKLDELARNLRSNRPEVRRTAGASNPDREADAPVHRIDAESAPDHRELQHEPEPIFPAVPEPRERTAATETGNPIAEATAAASNSADEPGLEPDQGIHPQAGEPIEPDSGFTQPDGNQHKDVLDRPNDGDRLDESIGDGVSRTIPERSIQPNVGADQWEGERSSDSDEQVSEAPEVEDPQVQQLQRQMAIAQSWSDDQLLAIAAEVQDYFKQPPSKPDINRAEQLHGELERLNALDRELLDRVYRQREELETLGPARSWKYLFGSNPKEVKTAEARLEQTRSEREILESRIQPIQKAFKALQQEARIYLEWRNSEKGEQMHQYRDILKLEPVQERIAQIHQVQEQIRQAQEQQRKKQEALNLLLEWKQTAIQLDRPQGYVERIQEITEEYRKGKPLTENQIERFNQDFADYREQVRQEQAQQRNRGFSR